jgi:hypothetical protein
MNEVQLMQIWKSYDEKLEKVLSLNMASITEIQKLKASSALRPSKGIKWIGILFGIVWVFFVGFLLWHSLSFSKIFFVVSAAINLIVSSIAIAIYIKHLVLIKQFDNSETIVEAQQKLVMLNTSNLQVLRLLLVQLPVFSTFFISFDWIQQSPLSFWLIQVPIVLLQAILGIWLYRNLHYKNHDKKWFKWLIGSGEFAAIKKAMDFLNEIEAYKQEK